MAEISINIRIADRDYPMRVAESDEAMIRKAAKELNECIRVYKERFKKEDKQDLLAMVAYDFWMEKTRAESEKTEQQKQIQEKLSAWGTIIEQSME